MTFKRFVEIGRAALLNYGKSYGRPVVIVDIIDQNRAIVDAPDMDPELEDIYYGSCCIVAELSEEGGIAKNLILNVTSLIWLASCYLDKGDHLTALRLELLRVNAIDIQMTTKKILRILRVKRCMVASHSGVHISPSCLLTFRGLIELLNKSNKCVSHRQDSGFAGQALIKSIIEG